MKSYYVYILSNKVNTVLYTGVTSNLELRVSQHREKVADGFTKKYSVSKLVYFETYTDVKIAIEREKQIKGLKRIKKNELVFSQNPDWHDLSNDWNEKR